MRMKLTFLIVALTLFAAHATNLRVAPKKVGKPPLGYVAKMTDVPLPPDVDGYVPPCKDAPRRQDVFPNAVPLTTDQLLSFVLPFDQQPEEIRSFAATCGGAVGVMAGIYTEFHLYCE